MGSGDEALTRRLASWRAEQEAAKERARKAILLYELGHQLEQAGDGAGALEHYRAARAADPTFRPALFVLERHLRSAGATEELAELLAAEARAAARPVEEVSAFVERAVVLEDGLERSAQARPLYDKGLERQPESLVASLMLELHLWRQGEAGEAQRIAGARAAHVRDDSLRAVLRLDGARGLEQQGDVDGALKVLEPPARVALERWRLLRERARIALQHERYPVLAETVEHMAIAAEARARGDSSVHSLTGGSLPPFADDSDARAQAVVQWHRLARLRADDLGDPAAALEAIDHALALMPDDPFLSYERMELCERAADPDGASVAARRLLKAIGPSPHAAIVHGRLAEVANVRGDIEARRVALEAALQAARGSAAVAAMLHEELIARGRYDVLIESLARRTEGSEPWRRCWQAADLAANVTKDLSRARALYRRAAELGADELWVARELYGTALRLDPKGEGGEAAAEAVERMLAAGGEERSRAQLLHQRYRRLRTTDEEAATALLRDSLAHRPTPAWVADAARVRAARVRDFDLLEGAHRLLGEQASSADLEIAHRCAAARAQARAGALAAAIETLRGLLDRAPSHPYALALHEELLRERGDHQAVVRLLRDSAHRSDDPAWVEQVLLRAGSVAEQGGDVDLAAGAYREAAKRHPGAIAPHWALSQLGRSRGQPALQMEALEALARHEKSAGTPGRACLAAGERHELVSGQLAGAAGYLRAALEDERVGSAAALLLVVSPGHRALHVEALERLVRDVRGLGAPALLRLLGQHLMEHASAGPKAERLDAVIQQVLRLQRHDRWALWAILRQPSVRGELAPKLEAIAAATPDAEVSPELLLQAGWAAAIAGREPDGVRPLLDAAANGASDAVRAAVARDERWTSRAGSDAASDAVERLRARIALDPNDPGGSLLAGLGRTLLLAGLASEALEVLQQVVDREPDDLASHEALRVAARLAESWDVWAAQSERLAARSEGSARARLLEEAGRALVERLGRPEEAERPLREAFGLDPTRTFAFRHAYRAAAARGADDVRLELLTARIAVVDDPDELVPMLREQARLRRMGGDARGIVEAATNLLMFEPGNPAALALLADARLRLGQHKQGAEALRELSALDLPPTERKLARLAAARVSLEDLGDPQDARRDIEAVDTMGLADASQLAFAAGLAEQVSSNDEAASLLVRAAAHADATDAAALERRAASLYMHQLFDPDSASAALRRALDASPTDLDAAEGLAAFLDVEGRLQVARDFRAAVRADLRNEPTNAEHIRKLRRSAVWTGERDLEWLALEALAVLGVATEEESHEARQLAGDGAAPEPSGRLGADATANLLAGDDPRELREIVARVDPFLVELDGRGLGGLGAGRRDVVKPEQDHACRDAVERLAGVLGADTERFYDGRSDRGGIHAVPHEDGKLSWVVGSDVTAPLSPAQRHRVGQLASAGAVGGLSLVAPSHDQAWSRMASLAAACEAVPVSWEADVDPELAARIRKLLPRKVRKSLPEALARAPAAEAARPACRALRLASLRGGLLLGGDLRLALRELLGREPSADSVADSLEGRELLLFWLSGGLASMRSGLGVALESGEPAPLALPGPAPAEAAREVVWEDALEQVVERTALAVPPVPVDEMLAGPDAMDVAPGEDALESRLAVLEGLAEHSQGSARARLLTAAAEVAEHLGDHERAGELASSACEGDARDLLAVRRARRAAMARGEWRRAVELAELEAQLPMTPDERAMLLVLSVLIALEQLDDKALAESAAKRALSIRPHSVATALLLARVQLLAGRSSEACAALERAAAAWQDGPSASVLLAEVARLADKGQDARRARRLFRQATELDPAAVDAWVGLARSARAAGEPGEAARALEAAARHVAEGPQRDAFLHAAARLLHLGAGQPNEAVAVIRDIASVPAVDARMDAAQAGGERKAVRDALAACAAATQRTEKALALLDLAWMCAHDGDGQEAERLLRDASRADPTLSAVRVAREELARRLGDVRQLARASRASGEGALAAAARAGLHRRNIAIERRFLEEPHADASEALCAGVVGLDVALEARDADRARSLLAAEPRSSGRLLALADLLFEEGHAAEAVHTLERLRDALPGDDVALTWLAAHVPPEQAAALWLEEHDGSEGVRAAFAATMAGRLLAQSGVEGAEEAFRKALESGPDYLPALWAIEEAARARGDGALVREMFVRRAEEAYAPADAAELLVRAALAGDDVDVSLLLRAHEAVPDDDVLADWLARLEGLVDDLTRAAVLEQSATGAPESWARVLRLRAARIYERAGEPGRASACLRDVAAGRDGFAELALDRTEPAAGEVERALERWTHIAEDARDHLSGALAHERLAEIALAADGPTQTAVEALWAILEHYPGHVASLRALERLAMAGDEDEPLARTTERFVTLGHPDDAAAHVRLAVRLASRTGRAEEVHELLRRAFDYVTVDLWLTRRLEASAREAGDARALAQALEEMAERLERPVERTATELRLAEAVVGQRSPRALVQRLVRLGNEAKGYPVFEELLAGLRESAGEPTEAAEGYERAARAASTVVLRSTLWQRAAIVWHERAGDHERASTALLEAAKLEPDDEELFERARRMLRQVGRHDVLVDLVESQLKRVRGNRERLVDLHLLLADLRQELGQLSAAKKSLRTVVATEPAHQQALERLSQVCRAEGDWRGAADALQRLSRASRDPNVLRPVLLELGDVYAQMRNRSGAEAAYRQLLELFPEDVTVRERLAALGKPRPSPPGS